MGKGARARVILVLRKRIWNAPTVSLVFPPFDDTGSLVYPPGSMVPPWVTASHFLVENREAELKPDTFSSLLLFCVFLFPLLLTPQRYNSFDCCLLGLLLY